ncbi:MAG: carbohydrate-binding family 9-like protein [Bacteroidota bacterium]
MKSTLTTLFVALLIGLAFFKCNEKKEKVNTEPYEYEVKRASVKPAINADWDQEIWENTKSVRLDNYMGERPEHFPETHAKVRYDDDYVYVTFRVKDQYVRAVATEVNGRVFQDSCVEFFFTPGQDTNKGYFNLEMNCKGVILFGYHLNNNETNGKVAEEDYQKIKIAYSLDDDVTTEIQEPKTWVVEYGIPIKILSNYMEVDQPKSGVSWRANFYKCADKTSHPHWLTWAPVDFPTPKFHLPEYFGKITFE